jgi:hypothetical protein
MDKEKRIEELALEKTKLASSLGYHREQMDLIITKMARIDGKMELLREMMEDEKKDEEE